MENRYVVRVSLDHRLNIVQYYALTRLVHWFVLVLSTYRIVKRMNSRATQQCNMFMQFTGCY